VLDTINLPWGHHGPRAANMIKDQARPFSFSERLPSSRRRQTNEPHPCWKGLVVTRSHTSLTLIRMTRLVQIRVVELKKSFGAHFDGGEAFFNPGALTMAASIGQGQGGRSVQGESITARCREPARAVVPVRSLEMDNPKSTERPSRGQSYEHRIVSA
jgi:hypothetical protein